MKKSYWIGLAVILFLFLVTFGVLARAPGEAVNADQRVMAIPTGSAQIKLAGTSEWLELGTGRELHSGDALRTSASGTIEMLWGERGVTRVESNSEIIIPVMPITMELRNVSSEIDVVKGSIWSRLLKVFDADSSFAVQSQQVVSTVRGTAFGFLVNGGLADVAVTDSVVSMRGVSADKPVFIREGRWGRFDAKGVQSMKNLTADQTWWKNNAQQDQDFDVAQRALIRSRFEKTIRSLPPIMRWVAMYVRGLTVDRTPAQRLWMARQTIADMTLNHQSVKFDWVLGDAKLWEGRNVDILLSDIRDGLYVLALDQSPEARQSATALSLARRSLLSPNPDVARFAYAEALDVDDQIDQLLMKMSADANADMQEQIIELKKNIDQKIVERSAYPSIVQKWQALRARLEFEGSGFTVSSSTNNGTSPSTAPRAPKLPKSAPVVSGVCPLTQLQMILSKSTLKPNETVSVTVKGLCKNASIVDITKKVYLSSGYPSDGTFVGNVFTPKKAGSIDLFAVLMQDGQTFNVKQSISVASAPVVKSMKAVRVSSMNGSNTVLTSGSIVLVGEAIWSDGSVSDMTTQCRWSVSDPLIGLISGRTLFPLKAGTEIVSCTIADAPNPSVTGSFSVTIVQDVYISPSAPINPQLNAIK